MLEALRKWGTIALGLASRVQRLFELQEDTAKAVGRLASEVQDLRLEIERLRAREEVLIARAEAAAAVAAAQVAVQTTTDISRRLGGIEAQLRLLPPPRP